MHYTPTPTISEAAQGISSSVVQVVGDGGSSTGIVVDAKKGYIITSRHINDRILNVDVWLPEGRMVGGLASRSDWATGLVLVELRNPEAVALDPINLEPLTSRVTSGDYLIAVSLPVGDKFATGTRVKAEWGISDLAGNEWFRLDAKPPMASVGGPVLDERLRRVVGLTVLKEVGGKVDTLVLSLESLQRQIDFLVPPLVSTSRPAVTTVPLESGKVSEGWTYFTQNCREGWTNCEYSNQGLGDYIRVEATAFADDNDATGELPELEFLCQANGTFYLNFYPNGLDFNENDSGMRLGVWIDGVQRELLPVAAYSYPTSAAYLSGQKIARLFYEAELTGNLIEVGSLSYEGKAIGVFDPVGFRSNYWRLPCAR